MMKKVTINKEAYLDKFLDFPLFSDFVHFAINDLETTLYKNNEDNVMILNSMVAYFIIGSPKDCDTNEVFDLIPEGSWIVTLPSEWDSVIKGYYKDNVKVMDRVLFDSSTIDLEYMKTLRVNPEDGLRIVPITERYLKDSIIVDDVTSRFFTTRDFLEFGFGYALIDSDDEVQGFSITNFPVLSNHAELHFRVGFSEGNKYRRKGLGLTLATYLIEECFKRGLDPIWDAANSTSAHIARKIGYKEKLKWKVYIVGNK